MMTRASKRWRLPGLTALMTVICLGSIQSSQAAQSGEQVFQSFCAGCHTIGKGKLVGPDLAGVTSRREASWLVRQIQEPDSLIAENDPIAMQLLQEANGVPMVRLGLTDAQVSAVIHIYRASNNKQLWHRDFPLNMCLP